MKSRCSPRYCKADRPLLRHWLLPGRQGAGKKPSQETGFTAGVSLLSEGKLERYAVLIRLFAPGLSLGKARFFYCGGAGAYGRRAPAAGKDVKET